MKERALLNRINRINELQIEKEALETMIESLKDELKADLVSKGIEEETAGDFTIRYKSVSSNRLDSKLLKADLPDIYTRYCKVSESMRFSIN